MALKYKGINKRLCTILHSNYNINKRFLLKSLKEDNLKSFSAILNKKALVNDLYIENLEKDLQFLANLGSYRSIRHRLKLPCRGQRTKTNSRTVRRLYNPMLALITKRSFSSYNLNNAKNYGF